MQTPGIETPPLADDELTSASMLDEIRRSAEYRLRQIEPLIEEAQRLRDVLEVIERRSPRAPSRTAVDGRADADRSKLGQRAAKGANKRVILELVGRQPGITPAEITAATGMKRTVVASTVSRLKRQGELCDHERGGVRLAGELTPTRSASLVAVQ
jgi:hypothetical protein